MTNGRKSERLRPLLATAHGVLAAQGRNLLLCDDALRVLRRLGKVPNGGLKNFIPPLRLLHRLLRIELTQAVELDADTVLVNGGSTLWTVDLRHGEIELSLSLAGGRKALYLARVQGLSEIPDGVWFGEYFSNPEREPVGLWHLPAGGRSWTQVFKFPSGQINHVHNVVPDYYRDCLWVLTGDFDHSPGLWQACRGIDSLNPVLRGQQLYRACWLWPREKDIFYATDTPLETNYLCRLHQCGEQWEVERLERLPGSSIYGLTQNDRAYFSTTVEPGEWDKGVIRGLLSRVPGPGIDGNRAHLFSYSRAEGLRHLIDAEHDGWPLPLFQFATYHLCAHQIADQILAYGVALKGHDDRVLRVPALDLPPGNSTKNSLPL